MNSALRSHQDAEITEMIFIDFECFLKACVLSKVLTTLFAFYDVIKSSGFLMRFGLDMKIRRCSVHVRILEFLFAVCKVC